MTVSAAISLEESLQEIGSLYHEQNPKVRIDYNFGGSGSLQQQIEQGAPVDLFVSASLREMNTLEAEGLVAEGTRRNLVSNEIVLVAPARLSGITGFGELAGPKVKKFAMGEPASVPAGEYSRQVLTFLRLYDKLRPKIIFTQDVRQVLTYVSTENVEAGMVYQTDAEIAAGAKVVAVAPPGSHAPIVYPVAVLKKSPLQSSAREFERFLLSPAAQQVFVKRGFRRVE